jgi:hypothetical protein
VRGGKGGVGYMGQVRDKGINDVKIMIGIILNRRKKKIKKGKRRGWTIYSSDVSVGAKLVGLGVGV